MVAVLLLKMSFSIGVLQQLNCGKGKIKLMLLCAIVVNRSAFAFKISPQIRRF